MLKDVQNIFFVNVSNILWKKSIAVTINHYKPPYNGARKSPFTVMVTSAKTGHPLRGGDLGKYTH